MACLHSRRLGDAYRPAPPAETRSGGKSAMCADQLKINAWNARPPTAPTLQLIGGNWPPFLDFGPLKGAERLRSLPVTRKYLLSEVGQPRPHLRVAQGVHGCGIEFGGDILRRAVGQPKPMPLRDVEPRQS